MRKLTFSHFIRRSYSQEIWQSADSRQVFPNPELHRVGHTFVVETMRIGARCESKDYMIEINNSSGDIEQGTVVCAESVFYLGQFEI